MNPAWPFGRICAVTVQIRLNGCSSVRENVSGRQNRRKILPRRGIDALSD